MTQASQIHVLIPAGGSSLRFGSDIKKQFMPWNATTVLDHTVAAFLGIENLAQIIVALPEADLKICESQNQNQSVRFVSGGDSRAQSVHRAFVALSQAEPQDVVLIHDAARPLVSRDIILRVIQAVCEHGAAIPAVAVSDTIKAMGHDGFITQTLDRRELRAAQTPQGFFYQHLKAAYEISHALGDSPLTDQHTDEAMLVEKVGVRIKIVDGSPQNLKITTPFDFEVAKVLWSFNNK